jgi:hypothetical protein
MLRRTLFRAPLALLLAILGLAAAAPAPAAQSEKPAAPAEKRNGTARLRIEVTGGDQHKPVSDASVYLRIAKDKKSEMDLKTNQEGIARSPAIPQGRVLIQIVAPGWKTYGEYHDISESEQTIQIHLVRPTTRWY